MQLQTITIRIYNAIFAGQHNTKFGIITNGVAHHFFIPVLENVQRQRRPRENDDLQRKQREKSRRHDTIMAFSQKGQQCTNFR